MEKQQAPIQSKDRPPPNTLETYPCGSDHTPSPMASRVPVEAETILNSPSARLTAVAVSVRAAHTIAFLGDSRGNLHKVFLGPNGEVEEYSVISVQKNAAISSDLILDQNEEHLFIMTPNMLQKRPVAECQQHPDCQSCLLAHDPYCGWCVLDGRSVIAPTPPLPPPPDEGLHLHFCSKVNSSEIKISFLVIKMFPIDEVEFPIDEDKVPSDEDEVSDIEDEVPRDVDEVLGDKNEFPSDKDEVQTVLKMFPSDEDEFPFDEAEINEDEFPRDEDEVPGDEDEVPSDDDEVPFHEDEVQTVMMRFLMMKSQCSRGQRPGEWLWSFDMDQQCLQVQELNPSNLSREESQTVSLTVPGLPLLDEGESYSCIFEDVHSPAVVSRDRVSCQSPNPGSLPVVPLGQDYITVSLSLRFGSVTITVRDFTFYDCTAVKQLSGRTPCRGCVRSRWGCNWCVQQHVCTHKPTCEDGAIIYNQHFKLPTSAPHTTKPVSPNPVTMATVALTTTTTRSVMMIAVPTSVMTTETINTPTLWTSSLHLPTTSSAQSTTGSPFLEVTTSPLPSVGTGKMSVVTRGIEASPAVTSSATEAAPDTVVLSEALDPVMPLVTPPPDPDSSTLNVVTAWSPTTPHEAKGALSTVETQTSPSQVVPLHTPFPVGEPPESDPLLNLTKPPSLGPSQESQPETGRPYHEVHLWTTEDMDVPTESALQPGNDSSTFSAATVLSGDGEIDHTPQSYPHMLDPDLDLDSQYIPANGFLPGDEGSYVSWGSSACPCLEKVQGSSLLPVGVERKITLLAQNLHLYQDVELDYECVLVIEGHTVVVDAFVESDDMNPSSFDITCQLHKYQYSSVGNQYNAMVYVKRRNTFHLDSSPDLFVTLYNCSVGRSDCSRCHTADQKYGCVWCGGAQASCLYSQSCSEPVQHTCPAPVIHSIEPLSGLLEGGTMVTISGSNLGQKVEDILHSVSVAGVPCSVISSLYEISSRIVCRTAASGGKNSGQVSVKVSGGELGLSTEMFTFQDPFVMSVSPHRGPKAGGTILTIIGRNLLTGRPSDLTVTVGRVSCHIMEPYSSSSLQCVTGSSNLTGQYRVTLHYSSGLRHLHSSTYRYTHNPNITLAMPTKSFLRGGRLIYVSGHNLDVVQEPRMVVTSSSFQLMQQRGKRMLPDHPECPENLQCFVREFSERCDVNSSSLMLCRSPSVDSSVMGSKMTVEFLLDNLRFNLSSLTPQGFTYEPNPDLRPLNQQDPMKAYRYNPGSFIQLEGENLDLAITKDEVVVLIGQGVCAVKTLTRNHLYCEPPPKQPPPISNGRKREGFDSLPEFTVQMGNLNFSLGKVQYDTIGLSTFPLEAQIGVGVGASIVALIVLIIVLIYRRKSKQAMKDYKKVQIQLENLETSVRDRCKKEFTDLMTEMMDMSSDLVGSGIPFLDYRMYAERIFFPGHRESPLRRDLDVQECRRQTVEQGLVQLSNLLNSKLFLTKFIHTLESQRTFSPRDRAYVASLLTVALHGKLEYFTDILKTLLNDLVEQYVAKNPKLMLRRTETVVEKLLTNWMSICLYAFLRDSAGESLYMLFRAIKHQVDKGPVDAVTGKAKYTLNDNRLLREDVEYRTLTLNVLVQGAGVSEYQPLPTKVLDCDTITQVKEKLLDQVYKGTSFSHRPHSDLLDLEWRSGVAGHLILSDEDLTSVVQGSWKRLNTLQHYKVPEGATVALVARHTKHIHHDNHDYMAGEKTPMLEDADEGGVRPWHLVKASEEPELPKHRRGSLRERERAKAIPEIYLTRLLSMKGTLQKFVDDLFTVILSTCRPVPLAVKYFFDLLDEQAGQHGISDSDTIHIWKTNSLPLRFWINIIKNPQFIFDVQASDHVDAVLSVISQTFMDSCTIAEHKLGRDSPINKLLYARDIPRYKQMVERYYSDIRQTVSASDQEMNSALAELSRNYSGELNYLVALHELYKYINKYYDQIITALEEDSTAQKMQLGYRLQQIAAAVENKVTDL
ncbi:Plexin-B1 Semaphorin receptor SEP [Takifugu flavidus]|uniref:Plexin-B1 Semaphorin receptor SEP n=1 Tax=Takifugu flavidus TaxID=433684 RepID=A0A5C6N5K6_9TELE|nr:Plexin-B1 Semaphorin receptor SEP [Takifugu flavidus]